MSEPNTFSDQIAAHLKEAWTADRQADWARGNGTYRSGCEPGALWPVREPSPPESPELHDHADAWLGLVLLATTALLAFGAGWWVRRWA